MEEIFAGKNFGQIGGFVQKPSKSSKISSDQILDFSPDRQNQFPPNLFFLFRHPQKLITAKFNFFLIRVNFYSVRHFCFQISEFLFPNFRIFIFGYNFAF